MNEETHERVQEERGVRPLLIELQQDREALKTRCHQLEKDNALLFRKLAHLEQEDRKVWGAIREMRAGGRKSPPRPAGDDQPQRALPADPPKPPRPAAQPTVITVWVPTKEHRGRSYGSLLGGYARQVVGAAAQEKLDECTDEHGEFDARGFWGSSILQHVARQPAGGGLWEWHGTAEWSERYGRWLFVGGEWKRPASGGIG